MKRIIGALGGASVALVVMAIPATAGYDKARSRYEALAPDLQTEIVLGVIASGDFEGMAEHGYTRRLYDAVRRFERREGLDANGVLDADELARLQDVAASFYGRLGNRYYTHPETGAKLLVPRKLFDGERPTADGLLFSREDGMLSLSFVSFPPERKSFDALYATLSSGGEDKRVIYTRRFKDHFVSTGIFKGRKFYTWMARTGTGTTGFTLSWSNAWDDMGRKLCVLLANAYLAFPR